MRIFSDRIGITTNDNIVQLTSINEQLRNTLWNVYQEFVLRRLMYQYGENLLKNYTNQVWHNLFKEPVDEAPTAIGRLNKYIKEYFVTHNWYEIYNLIEFSAKVGSVDTDKYVFNVNLILEKEHSGYRFINNVLAPISNTIEMGAIEEALTITQFTYDGHANIHLENAIKSIAEKPSADYRHSIKEAISAVGSIIRKTTGKNTFGDGLKYLEKNGVNINNQLKEGLNKFYNYTNDPTTGIRHEIVDTPNPPDFETAKFTLVCCSAFINYITPIAEKAKVSTKP